MNRLKWASLALCVALSIASPCRADLADQVSQGYTLGPPGSPTYKATANFVYDKDAGTLKVTLTNTTNPTAGGQNSSILTGLYFNAGTGVTLTTGTATTPAAETSSGAAYTFPSSGVGSSIGDGWVASGSHVATSADSFNQAYGSPSVTYNTLIHSAGLGFGEAPVFDSHQSNADLPIDGVNYGITSATGTPNANIGGTHTDVLAKGSITFNFTVTGTFTLPTSVAFVFGTNGPIGDVPGLPNVPPDITTPVPSSIVMLATLVAPGLGFWYRRRKALAG
jgi:hypothetical protein